MADITESDLLSFIKEQLIEYPRRPDGFGIIPIELAREIGRSRDKATDDLERLVAAGVLVRKMMNGNNPGGSGWRGFVYARPEDWERIGL